MLFLFSLCVSNLEKMVTLEDELYGIRPHGSPFHPHLPQAASSTSPGAAHLQVPPLPQRENLIFLCKLFLSL